MCDAHRVLVQGREAKPAKEVKPGEVITLKFASRVINLEVVAIPFTLPGKTSPENMYRIMNDIRVPKIKDE